MRTKNGNENGNGRKVIPMRKLKNGNSVSSNSENKLPVTLDDVIQQLDVKDIDVNSLTDVMVKSIYVLEATLFSQAVQESKRIERVRGLMEFVEDDLLKEGNYGELTNEEKIWLLEVLGKSLKNAESFTLKLHDGIALGLQNVDNITVRLPRRKKEELTPRNKSIVDRLRTTVVEMIKSKTS